MSAVAFPVGTNEVGGHAAHLPEGSPQASSPAESLTLNATSGALADALMLFILYGLAALAVIALSRQPGEVASLWFSNALAVGYLLTSTRRRWLLLLSAMAVANGMANWVSGDPWWLAVRFIPANVLEVLLAASLLRWAGLRDGNLRSARAMLIIMAFGALGPQLLGATVGALLVKGAELVGFEQAWRHWYVGSALGAVSVLALAVYVRRMSVADMRGELRSWRFLALAVLAVGVAIASLVKNPYPFIYIALPLLLAATVLEMGAVLVVCLLTSVTIALCLALGIFVLPPTTTHWQKMLVYLAYGAALVPAQLLAGAMADMRDSHARLAEATEELRLANQGLEQFVRMASHDMREPLNTVAQFSELVMQDHGAALPPEAQAWLGLVVRASRRMRVLLDDVLVYVRLQKDQSMSGRPVALDAVLSEVQHVLAAQIRASGAYLRSPAPLPTVMGHEPLLLLLFQNLVSNAIKFMPPGGQVPEIIITAEQVHTMVAVTVADNGIGIAPQDLPKLFMPFQRLNLRRHYDGTGLGLVLCRQIAEAQGGSITVASTPGQGSRFTVRLPLASGSRTEEERAVVGS